VLLVGAARLATTLLGGGGGGESGSDQPSAAPATGAVPVDPAPEDEGAAEEESYDVYTTRNPFTPVTGSQDESTAATGDDPASTESGAEGLPPAETDPATTDPGSGDAGGERVQLLDVTTDTTGQVVASFQVSGTVYDVGPGETFASEYQVVRLSVEDGSGVFQEGDREFALTTGEELLK
jgi:hypothetical protein